ncbi:MAG TPA: hypothetical protein VEB63_01880 [Chitinophagaceae bacterium]|nr:hypothetical protein [Chitinophagaceae bacterium]
MSSIKKTFGLLLGVIQVTAGFAQPAGVELNLRAAEVEVFRGHPLLLSVSITHPASRFHRQSNIATEREIEELREKIKFEPEKREQHEAEIRRLRTLLTPVPEVIIGNVAQPWYHSLKWTLVKNGETVPVVPEYLPVPPADAVARLDRGDLHKAYFGISPELSYGLAAGEYRLRVQVMSAAPSEVGIHLRESRLDSTVSSMLARARYFWHASRTPEGIAAVEAALRKDALIPEALVLRAELLIQEKNFSAALRNLQEAAALFNRQNPLRYEPPEYLLDLIEWVRKQQ